jgi:hypothetical protein
MNTKQKIVDWCAIHRKKIAYSLAALNISAGASLLIAQGPTTNGWLLLFIGGVLLIDTITTP